jgi:hypothetical protein
MSNINHTSDKLNTWSDNERSHQHLSSSETQAPLPASTGGRCQFSSRVSHRDLQTLWKTHLQMPKRTRAWTKVLPLCQLSRSKTTDDLHPKRHEGQSAVLFRQSPHHQIAHGRGLRNQSGTYRTTGYFLNDSAPRHHYRYQRCCGYRSQYGFGLLGCRTRHGGY